MKNEQWEFQASSSERLVIYRLLTACCSFSDISVKPHHCVKEYLLRRIREEDTDSRFQLLQGNINVAVHASGVNLLQTGVTGPLLLPNSY